MARWSGPAASSCLPRPSPLSLRRPPAHLPRPRRVGRARRIAQSADENIAARWIGSSAAGASRAIVTRDPPRRCCATLLAARGLSANFPATMSSLRGRDRGAARAARALGPRQQEQPDRLMADEVEEADEGDNDFYQQAFWAEAAEDVDYDAEQEDDEQAHDSFDSDFGDSTEWTTTTRRRRREEAREPKRKSSAYKDPKAKKPRPPPGKAAAPNKRKPRAPASNMPQANFPSSRTRARRPSRGRRPPRRGRRRSTRRRRRGRCGASRRRARSRCTGSRRTRSSRGALNRDHQPREPREDVGSGGGEAQGGRPRTQHVGAADQVALAPRGRLGARPSPSPTASRPSPTRSTPRRRGRNRLQCAVTGAPAKFFDPVTQAPYATLEAFRTLRGRTGGRRSGAA